MASSVSISHGFQAFLPSPAVEEEDEKPGMEGCPGGGGPVKPSGQRATGCSSLTGEDMAGSRSSVIVVVDRMEGGKSETLRVLLSFSRCSESRLRYLRRACP